VEFGWGPSSHYGLQTEEHCWGGHLQVTSGEILGVEKCFTRRGNSVPVASENSVEFDLTCSPRGEEVTNLNPEYRNVQGLIFEVKAPLDAALVLQANGLESRFSVAEALQQAHLLADREGALQTIKQQFGLTPGDIENPDIFYHNAWKIRIHRAHPLASYHVPFQFTDDDPPAGRNWYYLRVSQVDGQMAISQCLLH